MDNEKEQVVSFEIDDTGVILFPRAAFMACIRQAFFCVSYTKNSEIVLNTAKKRMNFSTIKTRMEHGRY